MTQDPYHWIKEKINLVQIGSKTRIAHVGAWAGRRNHYLGVEW